MVALSRFSMIGLIPSGPHALCSSSPLMSCLDFNGRHVTTELHCVELSSGKCDVLVSHFQTAVFSVGFDVDAINYERSPRFKCFNIKSQMIQKQQVAPVLYGNKN